MPITSNFTARIPFPVTSSSSPDKNRDIFGEAVKFFDQIPSWQRIACNSGSAGSGLGTTGDPDPAGEQAWAVWRALSASNPYDVIIKWSWSSFYTTNQLKIGSSNYGFGIGVAFHSSSAAWNGTTKNDLSDTIPSGAPWKSGSIVFPRQNELLGAHATEGNRQYIAAFSINPPSVGSNLVCAGDDDWFFMHLSTSNADTRWFYFGPYIPISQAYQEARSLPYVMLSSTSAEGFLLGQIYGGTALANTKNAGVTYQPASESIAKSRSRMVIASLSTVSSSYSNEIEVFYSSSAGSTINEYPILLTPCEENQISSQFGFIEHVRIINGDLNNYDFISPGNRLVLSGNTQMNYQLSIPYDNSLTASLPEGQIVNKDNLFVTSSLFVTASGGGGGGSTLVPIFRGETSPGVYVYNIGTPPPGASNVTIIGFV